MVADQQVHPDQRTTLFTSASCTSSVLTATPPTPAGASAATKPGPGKVQRDGGPWPSTVSLRIRRALEGKPGENTLIRMVCSENRNQGCGSWGEVRKQAVLPTKWSFWGFDRFSHQGQWSHLSQGHWPVFIATLGNCGWRAKDSWTGTTQGVTETILFATTTQLQCTCCVCCPACFISWHPSNSSGGWALFLVPFYRGETKTQSCQVIYNWRRTEPGLPDSVLFKYLFIESTMWHTGLSEPSSPDPKTLAFNICVGHSRISGL